jgi:hypothetical protein
VRLDPVDVASLPVPAALLDQRGRIVATTPEWQGAAPGTVCYHAGQARLLVGPEVPEWAEQEAVVRRLLDEVRAAVAVMPYEQAVCAAVLGSGLELVAGWPPNPNVVGSAAEMLAWAVTVIRARVPEVEVEVAEPVKDTPVPAPGQIALALLQLAANAHSHAGSRQLRLRVGPGPAFYVEWPAKQAAGGVAAGQSHSSLRRRWGLGYVRMVADYLGATALPVGPTAPGWNGSCLSLGNRRLTLPLALVVGGRTVRCTQTWDQGVRSLDPTVPSAIAADMGPVLDAARASPGTSVRHGLLTARRATRGTWVALPPETGPERTRDVVRGLDHDRALWTAPEPHATRVHGLIVQLERSLGAPPTAFAPETFVRDLPLACAALGVRAPAIRTILACPDPRATAFLLSELGGDLVVEPDGTYLAPGQDAARSPLPALLAPDQRGWIKLTPS